MSGIDTSGDILGGQLPKAPPRSWTSPVFWAKSTFFLVLALTLYIALAHARASFLKWQEKSHKLAMRRRHNIPDNDHRPFNVAYAAAQRALQNSTASSTPRGTSTRASSSRATPAADQQAMRQRAGAQELTIPSWALGGRAASVGVSSAYASNLTQSHLGRIKSQSSDLPTINIVEPTPSTESRVSRDSHGARRALSIADDDRQRARSDGPNHTRDSIVRQQFSDRGNGSDKRNSGIALKRGSKRGHQLDDEESLVDDRQVREKRARKVSKQYLPQSNNVEEEDEEVMDNEDQDQEMDVSEIDDVTEFPSSKRSRGKKRDRAEAGSTFGGDDDNSFEGEHGDDKSSRRRKRRTVGLKRKSDVGHRGKKRDRRLSESGSEHEEGNSSTKRSLRKKRGKKSVSPMEDDSGNGTSDISMEDGEQPVDPLCKGHQIGEEWESNGVRFKVGPNGNRLRQALVKKAKSRYQMPIDSIHPDSQANVEVYIESWLNEDEYQEAKARQALSWQESSNQSSGAQGSPSRTKPQSGKTLLWDSTITHPDSMAPPMARNLSGSSSSSMILTGSPRSNYRTSITSNAGLRTPRVSSTQKPLDFGRRVSTISLADGVPLSPSKSSGALPRPGSSRSFSKWEKQELEAEAMKKIRAKLEEAKKKQEPATLPTPGALASTASAPVLTFGKPADKPSATPQPEAPKKTVSFDTSAGIGLPTTSTTAPPQFTLPAPQAPAAPTNNAPPPASNAATAPSSTPNFFSKPAVPSPLGAPSAPTPPLFAPKPTSATPEPTNVGFGKPATQPTSVPTLSVPAAAPSPFSFGSAAKPSAPAPSANGPLFSASGPANKAGPSNTPAAPLPSLFSAGATPTSTTSSHPAQSASTPQSTQLPWPATAPQTSTTPVKPPVQPTKFSFGAAPAAPATASSSALSGALGMPKPPQTQTGPEAAKAPMKFSFGPAAPATTSSSLAPSITPQPASQEAPKTAFGTFGGANTTFGHSGATPSSPAPSPFANSATSGGAQNAPATFSFGAAKPAETTKTPSIFGAPTGTTSTNTKAPSIFGASPNTQAPKPAETNKPLAIFGAAASGQPAAPSTNGNAPKTIFSFGAPTAAPASAPAASSTPFSFNFGGAKPATSTATSNGTAPVAGTSSPFGGAPTQNGASAFGFKPSTTAPVFSFGTAGNQTQQK